LNRTRKLLAACAIALAAPALVAGCGDDDGGDEDPAEILRTALGQDTDYESGVVNIALEGSVEGAVSASVDADVSGPFQSGDEGEPPQIDLDATANASAEGIPQLPGGSLSFDLNGGVTLAEDSLFVTYDDTTYEASQRFYSKFSPLLESVESAGERTQEPENADSFVESLDNLENEGTEEIEGESLTHVSGDLDFASLAEQGSDGSVPFDTSQLEGLTGTVDVYVAEDDTVRRLDFGVNADGVDALAASGVDALDFTFSFGISDPNSEQTIAAPADPESLDDLLGQLGTSEAEIAGAIDRGLQGLVVPGGTEVPEIGEPGGAAADPEVQDCIAAAQDSDAIVECLEQGG